uniref:DDE_Tnp_1_7 domain-containing protein n=1 Tax=Glossina austeni TaxID=7395 RepID=A0A1A9V1D3_GLOAU
MHSNIAAEMPKQRKVLAYLENATSISLEYSVVESELHDSDGSHDSSAIIESSDEEILDEDNIDRSSDSDFENIANKGDDACDSLPVLKMKGAYITVDEQLFPTKGRCRFTQYMPNKPYKFGITFSLAPDVETKYVINGCSYLEKDEARNTSTPLSEFVVMKLLEPYTMNGRSVTTDNFFTSIPLALKLRSKNTSLVGANKRDLPKTCKPEKGRMARLSTLLYQSNVCTLTEQTK